MGLANDEPTLHQYYNVITVSLRSPTKLSETLRFNVIVCLHDDQLVEWTL